MQKHLTREYRTWLALLTMLSTALLTGCAGLRGPEVKDPVVATGVSLVEVAAQIQAADTALDNLERDLLVSPSNQRVVVLRQNIRSAAQGLQHAKELLAQGHVGAQDVQVVILHRAMLGVLAQISLLVED